MLPIDFILHLPHRKVASSFIRMTAAVDESGYHNFIRRSGIFSVTISTNDDPLPTGIPFTAWSGAGPVQTVAHHTRYHLYELVDGEQKEIPVFKFDNVIKFINTSIHKNVNIVATTTTDQPVPVAGGGSTISTLVNVVSTIANIVGTPISTPSASSTGTPSASSTGTRIPPPPRSLPTIAPYVASQLLELARIKHDMCPITVEEFTEGNTAVMPCGHLFMQMAIQETFKKDAHKCPMCRKPGIPTFV